MTVGLIGATINVPIWYPIAQLPEVSPEAVGLLAPASTAPLAVSLKVRDPQSSQYRRRERRDRSRLDAPAVLPQSGFVTNPVGATIHDVGRRSDGGVGVGPDRGIDRASLVDLGRETAPQAQPPHFGASESGLLVYPEDGGRCDRAAR